MSNTGKYFESQFIKCFNIIFTNDIKYNVIRLKDIGGPKVQDVGDYLVFYKMYVFNIELKSRKSGVVYKNDLPKNQLHKWSSFEYKPYRIPIYMIKNGKTKSYGKDHEE